MLANCGERRRPPPLALCELIARLLASLPAKQLQDAVNHAMGWEGEPSPEMVEAMNYEWQHPGAPLRAVARAAGVDHKTIAKWRTVRRYQFMLLARPARS